MLKDLYKSHIVSSLKSKLNYSNIMQVPKIVKVCLNMGLGVKATDSKFINSCVHDLSLIAAQKPVITYARKSIAGFKIRQGFAIGCKVTLRSNRMYEFLERLIYIVLPREQDFKGLSVAQFDGCGNISFGIKEHISFLEIDYDKIEKVLGLDVSIVTSAANDFDAKLLLMEFGFPFIN
ncbi:50S ribosomal protein L5 [Neoehrlichia mikurensis]|uniref:Large ribosomal subunit protein uL5 n=1 Tax=Neoehrlichia mikurensis TaxID=89586 RepID=A0A9Q9BVB6_9RICK|nr:50S ribosomal protein L5 [Neoehrlichia mikurensis]QXK91802.1 50S ribosomal protein L5 [Neoehrlichia mikurensis]QXK93015.1 50S ribosomal protein L5 [Neoehrlichia mikurensis]QXK93493.1 50S ribosomal protein L5 [Neoehrlichia mikurensis]UTO55553.1 50S ribosomal protein L5 [Neoehrlichia mikurensis]UTO56474.1 50S ribosomal protein L5 [Neoehrlichia mikurensis]